MRPDNSTQFGALAAGGVDFDADGYADLLVGAIGYAPDHSLHLYFGSPMGPGAAPDLSTNDPANSLFTFLRNAGDMDGDGFGDAVLTAYTSGRAALLHGGPARSSVTVVGGATLAGFGGFLAATGGGDYDLDGYSDVALSNGPPVQVLNARSPSFTWTVLRTLTGGAGFAAFGYPLASLAPARRRVGYL